jgi:excisionase family DNA binding protein
MDRDDSLRRLKQALRTHREALEELESALLEFEEAVNGEDQARPLREERLGLLAIPEVCQELGMGKSWVYRRLRSGEIPSVKLGRSIKVKRADLEEYLEKHHYQPSDAQQILVPSQ